MPRTTDTPFALAKSDARRIWLHAQRLDSTAPFGDGPQATPAAVAQLGYVQIDTINVIERSHHHILYSRIPGYRRQHLRQAQSVDKSVFEYWTHALSYIPTADMRFYVGAMKRHWQRRSVWFTSVTSADLRHILSPFDPLINQRKRLHLFFDYEHRFEAYVPKEKRLFGYFALPVLVGDEIVALLDLKADRAQQKMLLQRWTWLGKSSRRSHKKRIEDALHRFERFQLAR
jgi:uncharacterized protein YcaQ